MIHDSQFIQLLYQFGHFWSPEALAVELVAEQELGGLKMNDAVVQAATRSYQKYFAPELDQFTMRKAEFNGHSRPSIADGIAGPSTKALMEMPRCGCSDFAHPDTEQANWPEQCRNEITTSYRMSLSGVSDAKLRELWLEADGHWEAAFNLRMPLVDDYPNTRIFAFEANLPGSVLADQYLAQNNCSARLQGRFDSRTWNDVLLVTTITHEHGHALGLNHQNDPSATMYPSITNASMSRRGAPNRTDKAAMRRLGYTERTTPIPPDTPNPPDGDVNYTKVIDGLLTMASGTSGKAEETILAGVVAEVNRRAGLIDKF